MNKNKSVYFILILLSVVLVSSGIIQDINESDFNNGTMINVEYNSSGFLQLSPGNLTGNFTSQMFNAGSLSEWNNFS